MWMLVCERTAFFSAAFLFSWLASAHLWPPHQAKPVQPCLLLLLQVLCFLASPFEFPADSAPCKHDRCNPKSCACCEVLLTKRQDYATNANNAYTHSQLQGESRFKCDFFVNEPCPMPLCRHHLSKDRWSEHDSRKSLVFQWLKITRSTECIFLSTFLISLTTYLT